MNNKIKFSVTIIYQDEPSDWMDSWKLSGAQTETEDITDGATITANSFSTNTEDMIQINDVFVPGWSVSWQLSAAPPKECEEHQRSWSSCWGYRQQTR